MPSNQTPTAGQNVQVEVVVDGIPAEVTGDVVSFTENAQYQKLESRPLGSTEVKITHIPDGWAGEIEIDVRNGALDRIIDALNLARRNRVPTLVNITQTKFFEDGSSVRYTYPDVVLDFGNTSRRGEFVKTRLGWRTGKDRI